MIFWIILAAAVIIAILWYRNNGSEGIDLFFALFLAVIVSGVALLILFLIGLALPQNGQRTDTTVQLRALGTDNGIEGRFYFLGGGYINGERVLSYVTQDEFGGVRVGQTDGDRSVLYEDATPETATLTTHEWDGTHWWLAPLDWPWLDTYTYHIPPDSVVNDYEVTAQ